MSVLIRCVSRDEFAEFSTWSPLNFAIRPAPSSSHLFSTKRRNLALVRRRFFQISIWQNWKIFNTGLLLFFSTKTIFKNRKETEQTNTEKRKEKRMGVGYREKNKIQARLSFDWQIPPITVPWESAKKSITMENQLIESREWEPRIDDNHSRLIIILYAAVVGYVKLPAIFSPALRPKGSCTKVFNTWPTDDATVALIARIWFYHSTVSRHESWTSLKFNLV